MGPGSLTARAAVEPTRIGDWPAVEQAGDLAWCNCVREVPSVRRRGMAYPGPPASTGGLGQLPLWHVVPGAQPRPQVPQLFESVCLSTQTPKQTS